MPCAAVAENEIPSLRDYPAALRFALRADQLAAGKNPAALGYLAEAYALNKDFPQAVEAAETSAWPSRRPPSRASRRRGCANGCRMN